MPRLTWDGVGEKIYEAGVDHGVLYPTVPEHMVKVSRGTVLRQ